MADLDLDAIELRAVLGNRGPTGIEGAALVAEVRRLRAIEDTARILIHNAGGYQLDPDEEALRGALEANHG